MRGAAVNLSGTAMVAARTARSKAYAQALAQRGIRIKAAVVFGDNQQPKAGQSGTVPERNWTDSPVYLSDLAVPLTQTLDQVCDSVTDVVASHVNDTAVVEALASFSPELIIYSGYGSQIVGDRLLAMKSPFLHLHAGWLPDFRGSTTTYYHLLASRNCAVSALLLEKGIDTGRIVARKRYPKPPAGLDIDYLYDGAIRGDLLAEVLAHYGVHGEFPEAIDQTPAEGNTYYVIHPVLKHIAILSLR